MASEKYEFKAKNKVISTGANEHISVTKPVEVTGNAFCTQNSLPATDRMQSEASDTSARVGNMPSEASDASARVWKVLSEASDMSAQVGKVLSEGSDGFARVGKMLSEVSDAFARVWNMPSEASDTSARVWNMPSEASDTSARFGKMLSEASDMSARVWKMPSEDSTFAALTTEFLACAANQRFAITARIFVRSVAENRKNSRTFGAKDNIVRDFYKKHLRIYLLA